MSNRTPVYRSWKKAYGGDPDSNILRDLHRRLMKIEIAYSKSEDLIRVLESALVDAERHIRYLKGRIDSIDLGHLTDIVD